MGSYLNIRHFKTSRRASVCRRRGCGWRRALRQARRRAGPPNLVVDLAKGGLRKLVGRREFFLETANTGERAIDLIAQQCSKNAMHVFDFRNAMTDHGQIVARGDRESICFDALARP